MQLRDGLTALKMAASQMLARLPGDSSLIGPPRHVVRSASRWYQALGAEEKRRHDFHAIAPETPVRRRLPAHADEAINKLFIEMQDGLLAEQFVVEMSGGRYWGRSYGYVLAPGDVLLADVSPVLQNFGKPLTDINTHDALYQPKLPPLNKIAGRALALNTLFCSNFHHFLLDTLPKINLVRMAGLQLSDFDHFIFDYTNSPYQNEALRRLGIDTSKVMPSTQNLHVEPAQLVVPSYSEPGARPDIYQYSREGLQFVRELFLDQAPTKKRRVLLSRRLAACRRWLGEDEALPELEKLGFERVELELLPVPEQAKLFSEAECVIMPHGGGLANCVFCSPGTKVIELFDPGYLPTFMMPLSDVLSLEYHALVGEPNATDIDVPAQRVIDYVKSLL